MLKLDDYFDRMCDVEVTLIEIIIPFICNAENCSDSEDKQYPRCNMYMKHLCPAKRFNVHDIVNKIIESIIVAEDK